MAPTIYALLVGLEPDKTLHIVARDGWLGFSSVYRTRGGNQIEHQRIV